MQGMKLDRVRFEDSISPLPEYMLDEDYYDPFLYDTGNEEFQPAQSSQDHRVEKYKLLRKLLKTKSLCLTCTIIRTGKNQFVKARRGCQ